MVLPRIKGRKERRIKKLQRFHIKRNNIKKKGLMVVSSVELWDIRRSNVPTIMLGVQRKVHFLI